MSNSEKIKTFITFTQSTSAHE